MDFHHGFVEEVGAPLSGRSAVVNRTAAERDPAGAVLHKPGKAEHGNGAFAPDKEASEQGAGSTEQEARSLVTARKC